MARYEVIGLRDWSGSSTRLALVSNLWQAEVVIDEYEPTGSFVGIEVRRLHDGRLVDMQDWRWAVMAEQTLCTYRRKLRRARRVLARHNHTKQEEPSNYA